ncbi:MAG: hotdog fold thioesterase [Salinivirgaceae bacterium]|jgi:1,4-dihydroxy-2-naphthoyl-CoA hydrolase|nr:hotdog fold thioesterase [Salinivirgaceae bacterium]
MDEAKIISEINNLVKNTMIDHLGIEFTKFGEDYIEATMPVNSNTINPARILHGGAMMALAETVGSALSLLLIDRETQDIRGLEINGNHVRSASSGIVTGRANLIHKGKQTHVSEIKITDQGGNLLNTSRITNMVVDLES